MDSSLFTEYEQRVIECALASNCKLNRTDSLVKKVLITKFVNNVRNFMFYRHDKVNEFMLDAVEIVFDDNKFFCKEDF